MKYVIIKISTIHGDREFDAVILENTNCENLEFFVNRYISKYWSNFSYREKNKWFFDNGEVCSKWTNYQELSEEHYNILKNYI
jgi:hypothetical protein